MEHIEGKQPLRWGAEMERWMEEHKVVVGKLEVESGARRTEGGEAKRGQERKITDREHAVGIL